MPCELSKHILSNPEAYLLNKRHPYGIADEETEKLTDDAL
jgi:hypothetical protein